MFTLKNVKFGEILFIEELQVPSEKITCIVGESGSGKSTFIRLLNNLASVDEGEITYNNKPIEDYDPVNLRREVVMVPQVPIIFEGTVKDNLIMGLTFSEQETPDDEVLKNTLEAVHLRKPLDGEADDLSGGEKQRLGLARALLMDPEVFLLDEPTSALDEETEELVIRNVIETIRKRKKTAVIVTHSKKVADTYGENIVEIKGGSIVSREEIS
ncbi:MAG: ABC transporter ATP-binding protein [Bacillus sp. (in: Bacteria)]|nr:ABC transporter ATP-binding protein [Bacillus sp. (in: firmicutes)]